MRAIIDMLCDASVLVPLIVPEANSEDIVSAIRALGTAIVSDFAFGEVCSAVSIKVQRREIASDEGSRIISEFEMWAERYAQRAATESGDVAMAARFVRRFELGLRMPDALYLALAVRLAVPIVTLDHRQAIGAKALGIPLIIPALKS
jgi:uncharacterized protein